MGVEAEKKRERSIETENRTDYSRGEKRGYCVTEGDGGPTDIYIYTERCEKARKMNLQ